MKNILLFLATAAVAFGQADVGRLVGTVSDASGAVIPKASVTVTSAKTGQGRTAISNDQGNYIVTQLQPATYGVSATAPGLGAQEYRDISLSVGQERTLNIILQPASVTTEVNVSGGEMAVVDVSSARIGVNVSEREVASLPLNGRQVSQLYLLTPGAVNYGSGTFDDIRFSGRSNEQNAIRFDGIEGSAIIDTNPGNLNGESTSSFRLQSSAENIQEFRVESNNYPAEFGTGTGGQISIVTKSGSNVLHGSLFEYLRNDAFDARNYFDGGDKSKLRLNQFGGSLGGPIVTDKMFFFGSYEGLRQGTGTPIVESTLSRTVRARTGIDPAIRPLLNAFPLGQIPSPDPNFDIITLNANNRVNEDYGGIRFDYNFSPSYRLSGRYFRDQGNAAFVQNSTGSQYLQTAVPQNAVVSLSQVLSPTVINETKVGFNGYKTRASGVPGPSPGVNLSGVTLNLTGSVALAGIAGQGGSAGLATPTGLIRLSSAFNGRGAPYTNYTTSYIDNLNVVHLNHNMKFGVEIRPISLANDQQGGTTYTFSNVGSFLQNSPASIQFLGDLSDVSPFTGLGGQIHLRQIYYIGYAQDEWKVTPELTLSYGLRYEYYSAIHESRDKNVFFDLRTGAIYPKTPKDWYNTSKLNFGPRFGFSYSPKRFNGKTAFRVGGGYFFGPGQTEDQIQPAANDRISRTITSGALLRYPLDIPALVSSYNVNDPNLGYQPRAYAPGYTIPEKILQYTASVQQELPGDAVLTVAYVGSQGRNLFLRSVTNLITGVTTDPATGRFSVAREFGNRFAEVDYKTSGGTSHYNALETSLNRRFSKGFTLGSQYTWAHDIGNSGGANEARTSSNPFNFAADHGDNTFDVRQSFNLSTLYELPYGKGQRFGRDSNRFTQAALGGWQLGGIVNARSGLPIEVLVTRPDVICQFRSGQNNGLYVNPNGSVCPGGSLAVINTLGGGNSRNIRRPDLVAGTNGYQKATKTNWIDPAAFAVPLPGTFGDLARDAFKGPGLAQLDLTLDKKFAITERSNIEFRAEFYNILNHTNFQAPGGGVIRLTNPLPSVRADGTLTTGVQPGQAFSARTAGGNFGQLTSTVSNQIGLGTNRQIQLALRFNF